MKVLAFYLPQFHPIPENDAWWGKGFTEWTNVVRTRPRFKGHHQPQLPADLGFTDLRLEETRIAQAELAKAFGIDGFCYYHYWFNGKMLLERPFNEVLATGRPDFPFCLCWANENWTRAWDGLEREVLMKQEYNREDSIRHITWLCNAFKDKRYITVNGKPLLLIYRTDNIPDLKERIALWRTVTKEAGFPGLYLCSVRSNFDRREEPGIVAAGFDAIVGFQPYNRDFPRASPLVFARLAFNNVFNKLVERLGLRRIVPVLNEDNILDYRKMAEHAMQAPHPSAYRKFPCVTPSWDNSARRFRATILQNDDPRTLTEWLLNCFRRVERYDEDEQMVFINAWNEWAEGCHLEPDLRNGSMFLEATKEAVDGYRAGRRGKA